MTDVAESSMTKPELLPLTAAPAELSAATIKEQLIAYRKAEEIRRKIKNEQKYGEARKKLDSDIEQELNHIKELLASGHLCEDKVPAFPLKIPYDYMATEMRDEVIAKWVALGWNIHYAGFPDKTFLVINLPYSNPNPPKTEKPLSELTLEDMTDLGEDPVFVEKISEINKSIEADNKRETLALIDHLNPIERHYFELMSLKNAKED